ncbi:MAG: DUF357 domain-containing protein [Nanoarchaeota archaeon]
MEGNEGVTDTITKEHLDKYFSITNEALEMVKSHEMDVDRIENATDFLDMSQRYYNDAKHFMEKGNFVLALSALNYAHGWLDAGARIRLFKVNDSRLFTVDNKEEKS